MPADRGSAWVILAASVGGNYLNGVLVYIVGVVHAELLEVFQQDVTSTSWTGALYSSLASLAAPLASWLVSWFGCRPCTVFGGILMGVGFASSAFATSVTQLLFTYGLIAGTGAGLTYSSVLMVVAFHFHKYRALASGISVAGTALGILSGSLIAQSLIDTYEMGGAFLLIGGIALHYCVFGMFFTPSQYEGKKLRNRATVASTIQDEREASSVVEKEKLLQEQTQSCIKMETHIEPCSLHKCCRHKESGYGHGTAIPGDSGIYLTNETIDPTEQEKCDSLTVVLGTQDGDPNISEKTNMSSSTEKSVKDVSAGRVKETSVPLQSCCADMDNGRSWKNERPPIKSCCEGAPSTVCRSDRVLHSAQGQTEKDISRIYQQCNDLAIEYNGLIPDQDDSQRDHCSDLRTTLHNDLRPMSLCPCSSSTGKETSALSRGTLAAWLRSKTSSLTSLLQNLPLVFHCLNLFFFGVMASGVYLHLPEYSKTQGSTPKMAAVLFVGHGIASFLARLGVGFVANVTEVRPLLLSVGLTGVGGVTTALFPFYSVSYGGQMVFSSVFGVVTGGLYTLINVLTVDLVGLDSLAAATGLEVFINGIGYIMGPPLAGVVVDNGGTYTHSFLFLGGAMLLASLSDVVARGLQIRAEKTKPVPEST